MVTIKGDLGCDERDDVHLDGSDRQRPQAMLDWIGGERRCWEIGQMRTYKGGRTALAGWDIRGWSVTSVKVLTTLPGASSDVTCSVWGTTDSGIEPADGDDGTGCSVVKASWLS